MPALIPVDEHDLAYAAGYVDGEGCLPVSPRTWKIAVLVSNTHRPTIEWFHARFGGSTTKARPPRKANHRPIYTWQIVRRDAHRFLRQTVPYLNEKTVQALLMISIQQTMGMGRVGVRTPPDVTEERMRLYDLLQRTKHVTW